MKQKILPFLFCVVLCSCQTTVLEKPLPKITSEKDIISFIDNPKRWNNKEFYIKIYPLEYGSDKSYLVCFEKCDPSFADRTPFLIYTDKDRFKGYSGDKSELVKVHYNSDCFYRKAICVDMRFGLMTEIP